MLVSNLRLCTKKLSFSLSLTAFVFLSSSYVLAAPSFQEAFDKHITVMLLIDPSNGKIIDANPAASRFYGYSRNKLRSMSIQEINQLTAKQVAEERKLAKDEGRNFFIFRHKLENQTIRTVEVHSVPLNFNGQTILFSIIRDISEERNLKKELWHYQSRLEKMVDLQTESIRTRNKYIVLILGLGIAVLIAIVAFLLITIRRQKVAEKATLETEQQLRDLLNNTSSVIYIKDLSGRYKFINRIFERLFSIRLDQIRGMTDHDIFPHDKADTFRENDIAALRSDAPIEMEEVVPQDDGNHIYISVKFPLKSVSGDPYAVCGISTDITERKQLEEQVRRSQKMEAVGYLTGGIAHDFNNILGIIQGNLELIQRLASGNSSILKRADSALRGANRGAVLTKKLLSFSHKVPEKTSVINVNDTISGMNEIVAKSLTPSIKVETHLSEDLWKVEVDPNDLEDALLNLALNSGDAQPDGGVLTIETANKTLDQSYADRKPKGQAGDFVMIAVSDAGVGMTEDVKRRAFEPFFTTKERGKGTGLGLSMVYGFARRSGGHIDLYSEVGEGTTFKIFIPATNGDPKAEDEVDAPIDLPRGTEKILVVDDEDDLREIAVAQLENLGYEVVSAANGKQALQEIGDGGKFDLLFSDVVMPGDFDGFQLANTAHAENPSLKVLLASGFTQKRMEHLSSDDEYLALVASRMLEKPYSQIELAYAVREALDHVG